MPKFQITIQALLGDNRSGPHFNIQLDAASYIDAFAKAAPELEKALNESGLTVAPVLAVKAADAKPA